MGKELAFRYAARPGTKLVLGDLNLNAIEETKQEINSRFANQDVQVVKVDVSKEDECKNLVETAV